MTTRRGAGRLGAGADTDVLSCWSAYNLELIVTPAPAPLSVPETTEVRGEISDWMSRIKVKLNVRSPWCSFEWASSILCNRMTSRFDAVTTWSIASCHPRAMQPSHQTTRERSSVAKVHAWVSPGALPCCCRHAVRSGTGPPAWARPGWSCSLPCHKCRAG